MSLIKMMVMFFSDMAGDHSCCFKLPELQRHWLDQVHQTHGPVDGDQFCIRMRQTRTAVRQPVPFERPRSENSCGGSLAS